LKHVVKVSAGTTLERSETGSDKWRMGITADGTGVTTAEETCLDDTVIVGDLPGEYGGRTVLGAAVELRENRRRQRSRIYPCAPNK